MGQRESASQRDAGVPVLRVLHLSLGQISFSSASESNTPSHRTCPSGQTQAAAGTYTARPEPSDFSVHSAMNMNRAPSAWGGVKCGSGPHVIEVEQWLDLT